MMPYILISFSEKENVYANVNLHDNFYLHTNKLHPPQ